MPSTVCLHLRFGAEQASQSWGWNFVAEMLGDAGSGDDK